MLFLGFYRFYASLSAGILGYLFLGRNFWIALACTVGLRSCWFFIERCIRTARIEKYFKQHAFEFKQQLGPYGIRMANKAESDRRIKNSLAEVFVPDVKLVQKAFDQLKVLDALYTAGMRPDPESWQLHDCKLKYASYRLEKNGKTAGK